MARPRLPQQRKRAELDVSLAIVNIVFLLIFFFLATGSLLNPTDSGIDLARTRDLPIEKLPRPILVVEGQAGMTLNGDPIEPGQLGVALADEFVLYVLIDKTEAAQLLLELLARPGLEGLDIRLVTIRETGGGKS